MQLLQGSTWRGRAAGVVFSALALFGVAAADTICVPDDYDTIQEAIDAAVDGDEICVAPGTYHETIDFIGKAVRLYSTDGPEVTTIDAEGGGSVVTCKRLEGAATVLEGFTITGGHADYGGGMNNFGTSPTVIGCTFDANRASGDGGGMANFVGSPTVTNCAFIGNAAFTGGGMYNSRGQPTLTNCSFIQNRASHRGGGMNNWNSGSPAVTNCTFTGNTAGDPWGPGIGGGMHNWEGSNPMVMNCTFVSNTASDSGGGMSNYHCSPIVTNCTFNGNRSDGWSNEYEEHMGEGGGMSDWGSNPTVTHCAFAGNSAYQGGGMSNRNSSSPTITNCMFIANAADWYGGGMNNFSDSSPTGTNCTFIANTAGLGGGVGGSTGAFANSIFWSNTPQSIHGSPVVTYSDVEGGYDGAGNINADPLCDAEGRPQAGSPCIDAGNNDAVPEGIVKDLDGNLRFADDPDTEDTGNGAPPIVDMGAYEFQVPCLGDLDDDGSVNFDDLVLVLAAWGNEGGPEDLDGSGTVDFGDLLIVLDSWGPCE